ncbi:MAG: alpha/beta hydrolase [Pseudomonadota bacterium]
MIDAHVRRFGHGPRAAHFIHCNLSSGRAWDPLIPFVDDAVAATAVDLLGQGRSPMPDRDLDYQMQCAQASIAVMEQAGPQDLVGHSFGATVALRVANLRPDLVRSMVLFEPIMFCLLKDVAHPQWDALIEMERPFHDAQKQGDQLRAAELFISKWGMPGSWQKMPPDMRQGLADKMWLIEIQAGAVLEDNDWRLTLNDIAQMKMPTLLMAGGDSPPTMEATARVIGDHMPNAQVDVLAGSGHMLPLTHSKDVAEAMARFWATA